MNTLFPDVDGFGVSFEEMQKYMPLILAFYDVSPMGFLSWRWASVHVCDGQLATFVSSMRCPALGEFTTGFLEHVFVNLDNDCDGKLSQGRFLKQRVKWANSEPLTEYVILLKMRSMVRVCVEYSETVHVYSLQVKAVM